MIFKKYFLAFFFSVTISLVYSLSDLSWIKNVGARKAPSSKKIYWVNSFGATNDTGKVITKIIQQAIDKCAKEGGGIVAFKPGVYKTGSIFLKSGVHLRIDKDVLIKGSTSFDD